MHHMPPSKGRKGVSRDFSVTFFVVGETEARPASGESAQRDRDSPAGMSYYRLV